MQVLQNLVINAHICWAINLLQALNKISSIFKFAILENMKVISCQRIEMAKIHENPDVKCDAS